MSENCWEFKSCGRDADCLEESEHGICPATIEDKVDGINSGINGGRVCWALDSTLCDGKIQGVYAQKIIKCMSCNFYQKVLKEERNRDFKSPTFILKMLNQ